MADRSGGGGIGAALPRLEDARLLTGQGRYSDDFSAPDQVYGVVVRAPHAHARIVSIDTPAARAMPGVLVLTSLAAITHRLHARSSAGYREIASRLLVRLWCHGAGRSRDAAPLDYWMLNSTRWEGHLKLRTHLWSWISATSWRVNSADS